MASSKDIELAIKAKDLASKPLQEIGAAVEKLVSAVADVVPASEKGGKNLTELTAVAGQLQKALSGLKADSSIIEQFQLLTQNIAATSKKLQALRERSTAAKLALDQAAAPTKALTAEVQASARALAAQAKAFVNLHSKLDTLKTKAAAAGIDVKNLAGAQANIDAAFAKAAPAYAKVNEAIDLYSLNQRKAAEAARIAAVAAEQTALTEKAQAAAAAEATAMEMRFTKVLNEQAKAAGSAAGGHSSLLHSFTLFRDEGRKSISIFQEVRANIAAMATQFLGFYAAIETVRSGFESLESVEGSKSILTSAFGGSGAAKELDYVRGQADRLGLSYIELAKNYARFAATASGNGKSRSETRQVFETFAEAARVKNLSAEQQASIFESLDKVFAKDAVGATDLFRKLSKDLPEAAAIFRKSISTLDGTPLSTEQFDRLLKSGKITADMFVKFAADYRASFQDQLPAATNTTTAALQRFQSAWDEFKISILENGVLDSFKKTLQDLTVFFKSDDGKRFSTELAQGARMIADGLGLVVRNLDTVRNALVVLATLWAANIGKAFVLDLIRVGEGFQRINLAVEALTKSAKGAGAVIGKMSALLAAFYTGEDIGTWLYNNVAGVRVAGAAVIGSFALMFQKIGDLASLMWAKIFHPSNVEALKAQQEKAWAASIANFKEQLAGAAGPQDDGAPASPGAAGSKGAATPTVQTPEQKRAADLAAQKMLDEELFTAAKSLQTRLSTMRGELLKKDATDIKGYLAGLSESFKPLYQEIDKLKQDFPQNSKAMVSSLTAQLNAVKAMTLKDAGNKFNEDKAKRDLQEITSLLQHRDNLIQNQTRKTSEGVQSAETAQSNISDITKASNPTILANVQKLQQFIATLPKNVQTSLQQTTDQLKSVLDRLEERPEKNVIKDVTQQEADISSLLTLRDAKMGAIKALAQSHHLTTVQEREELQKINDEYAGIGDKADALLTYIQTSKDLTDEQRKALDSVVVKLEVVKANASKVPPEIYSANAAAEDMASGLTNVGKAFAKAIGQGHGLGAAFTSAWQAFRQFASDFLLKIGEMIAKQTLLKQLQEGGALSGGPSWLSGAVTAVLGGVAGGGGPATGVDTAAFNADLSSMGGALSAGASAAMYHSGGIVGHGAPSHMSVMKDVFDNARKFHRGGMPGLRPDEVPIIAQRGEEVLSKSSPRNAMNGGAHGSAPQHIQVINAMDHDEIVRRGLAAPSNTKVILNMIRGNRTAIRQALA